MSEQKQTVYEFAGFRLNALRHGLERADGSPVTLKPKALDILLVLVARHGQTVGKEELIKLAWTETHVEEGNLMVHMSLLRKALGDNKSEPKFIVTVPGKGYRFVANVTEAASGKEMSSRATQPQTAQPERSAWTALRAPVIIFTGLFVISIIIISVAWVMNSKDNTLNLFSSPRLIKLTSSGKTIDAAISPDGRFVAYVLKEKDLQSVWLRQLSAGSDVQIIAPTADVAYLGLAFSPDGESLYFLKGAKGNFNSIYRTSSIGGQEVKLAEDIDSVPGISPDGKTLAFISGIPDQKETALFTLSADGGTVDKLAGLSTENGFVLSARPAWSPDGGTLLCAVKKQDEKGKYNALISVDAISGKISEINSQRFSQISQTAWTPDARALLVAGATEDAGELNQIWVVDPVRGTSRRITNDLHDYRELSLTGDGKTLLTINTTLQSNIWLVANPDAGGGEQITSTNQDGSGGLAWSPNGDLIYASRGSENIDLWRYDKDARKQMITSGAGNNSQPAISTDGKTIAFVSDRDGAPHIWLADADGSNPRKLTNGSDDGSPDWSPDSKTIIYRSYLQGIPAIFSIAPTGGETAQLTEKISGRPQFSPDGQKILSTYRSEGLAQQKVAVISAAGGEPETIFNFTSSLFRWSEKGQAILFVNILADGGTNIWRQPIDPKLPPAAITKWSDKRIYWFDISPDGKTLACARGENLSDVVLISDNPNQK